MISEILLNTKALLEKQSLTVAISNGKITYTSSKRGVAPLLDFIESGTELKGFSAADKVVGKAAAYLYVILGIKEVYAGIVSKLSLEVFSRYGIRAWYGTLVDGIINREGTGPCPMENAVRDIDDPKEAYSVILKTLKKLKEQKE